MAVTRDRCYGHSWHSDRGCGNAEEAIRMKKGGEVQQD